MRRVFNNGWKIVAVVSLILWVPTIALASAGLFSSNSSSTPAVTGVNSAAGGTGIKGQGAKYGVFSNGPLGVAAGKPLSCTKCVGPGAMKAAATQPQELASGESESGFFATGGDPIADNWLTSIAFVGPLAAPIDPAHVLFRASNPLVGTKCPAPGSATPGYLCLYYTKDAHLVFEGVEATTRYGVAVQFHFSGVHEPFLAGTYTVKAP